MSEQSVSRREALQRVGKIAAYSAPAAVVLLTAERALARSVGGEKPRKERKPKIRKPKFRKPSRRGRN
ncbi:MAG: hypothetical protein GC199_02355 [Alphaproteobacteria bacterium]|nr:hypothetical protein [Alphaproteobacteria bacterium]